MSANGKVFGKQGQRPGAKESLDIWQKNKRKAGVDWTSVDQVTLRAAMMAALSADGALMFSQAGGGLGVCITLFMGNSKAREYAGSTEDMNEMLGQIIDFCESGAEDVREIVRSALHNNGELG